MKRIIRTAPSALVGVPIALLYALLVRLTFSSNEFKLVVFKLVLSTMTVGFLFIVPIAIGALTVRFAPGEVRRSISYAIFAPWISIGIVTIGAMALYLEAAVCIAMAVPLFLFFSSLGGYFFRDKTPDGSKSPQNAMLGIILLAPYIVTPLETRIPEHDSYRYVETHIIINSFVSSVWENVVSVPYISTEEQGLSMFHLLGIPRLLEAPLSYDGIGGTRIVKFDYGLSFIETVTHWDRFKSVSFSILPNAESPAPAPFSMVGGRYFAVTEMNYWIDDAGSGAVILHVRSRHRLSTHFNSYAGIWTDLMLSSLQTYVLRMIKTRAEMSPQGIHE